MYFSWRATHSVFFLKSKSLCTFLKSKDLCRPTFSKSKADLSEEQDFRVIFPSFLLWAIFLFELFLEEQDFLGILLLFLTATTFCYFSWRARLFGVGFFEEHDFLYIPWRAEQTTRHSRMCKISIDLDFLCIFSDIYFILIYFIERQFSVFSCYIRSHLLSTSPYREVIVALLLGLVLKYVHWFSV